MTIDTVSYVGMLMQKRANAIAHASLFHLDRREDIMHYESNHKEIGFIGFWVGGGNVSFSPNNPYISPATIEICERCKQEYWLSEIRKKKLAACIKANKKYILSCLDCYMELLDPGLACVLKFFQPQPPTLVPDESVP